MINVPQFRVETVVPPDVEDDPVVACCYTEVDAEETAAALAKVGFDAKVYYHSTLLHEFFAESNFGSVDMPCTKDRTKCCPDDASCCMVHD